MITTSDAVPAAIGFVAAGLDAERSGSKVEAGTGIRSDGAPDPDPFSAGAPYFEAVAAALRRTGYLDA